MIVELFGLEINWPSQISGLIGCVLCIIAFFQNERVKFIWISTFGYSFNIGETILLLFTGSNTWANIFATAIAIVRNLLLLYFLVKKKKETPMLFAVGFTILLWGASIPFFNEWYTFIPPVAVTIQTITLFFKNFLVGKIGNVFFEGSYLVYGLVVGAYSCIIRDGFGTIATLVSIVLFLILQSKNKKQETITDPNEKNS